MISGSPNTCPKIQSYAIGLIVLTKNYSGIDNYNIECKNRGNGGVRAMEIADDFFFLGFKRTVKEKKNNVPDYSKAPLTQTLAKSSRVSP